jgi:hypothetical protein
MGFLAHKISEFSPHLFWDVDKNSLSFEKSKKLIIQRVLEYGMLTDWKIIKHQYGIKEIAETALHLKELDKRSASFISTLSKIPKEKFLCYITKPSIPKHWNF